MQPVLERCDADGIPAYLESTKERNVGFYEQHGFAVIGTTIPHSTVRRCGACGVRRR